MRRVTLSAPGKNAIGTQVMKGLLGELESAQGEPLLLTGAGDAFSAGLNLNEVVRLDNQEMSAFLRMLDRVVEALFLYPGPTVAWVNGHAIAGGCVLAQCCDHRVAATGSPALVGLNEVAIGVVFPPRILALLRGRLPKSTIEQIILGAGLYGVDGARAVGLLDELAADAEAAAVERLTVLSRHPREAYVRTKLSLRSGMMDVSLAEQRRFRDEVVPMWTAPELREKILAVLKRA